MNLTASPTGLAGAGNATLGAATLTAGGDNSSTTFSGMISGTGALSKSGSGTLTLSGTNNYTGGTTVSAGTLAGTTTSLQGAIVNNAAVTFDQTTDGTYAGAMSSTGSLTKQRRRDAGRSPARAPIAGGTTISGGLVNFTAGNNLGSGNITLNGGGLQWATRKHHRHLRAPERARGERRHLRHQWQQRELRYRVERWRAHQAGHGYAHAFRRKQLFRRDGRERRERCRRAQPTCFASS